MEKRGRRRPASTAESRTTRASSKSPSRRSSTSRKSPTRKSPSRKSPARTTSPSRTTQRRSGRNKLTDNDTASETDDSKSDILTKFSILVSPLKLDKDGLVAKSGKGSKTPNKALNISNDGDDEVASLTAKYLNDKLRSGENPTPSDLSAKRSYSRSISRSVLEDEEWSHSDASEKNNALYGNRITRSRSKSQKLLRREKNLNDDAAAEFGGSIGASILILLLPVLCFFTQYVCSRPECSVKSVRLEKLKLISTYFSFEASYLYLAFTWIVTVLSVIPYTGIKRQLPQSSTNDASLPFLFNGFFTAFAILGGLITTEFYFKYPIYTLIYKNYQQLVFIGFIYSLTLSVWCFVRSRYFPVRSWNPYGKSGRLVSDLFVGREINPRWLNIFDIKLIHRRIALISVLIFNLIFLSRNIKFIASPTTIEAPLTYTEIAAQFIQNIKYEPIAATVSILISLYVLDALIFEHHLISSFELQSEGVGAQLLLQYASYPIWTSLIAKFALQHKISGVPNWLLALVSLLFIAGVILKRLSNELKYHYRTYPTSKRSSSKQIYQSLEQFLSFPTTFIYNT